MKKLDTVKKPESFLKEYAQRLSDDNLKFVYSRLSQRYAGDLSEVLEFFSNSKEMDHWLSSAKSSWELYDMIDTSYKFVEKEFVVRIGELD